MNRVMIVKVDPYSKTGVLLIPQLVQKFSEVLSQLGDEDDSIAVNFFPRLWAKDPGVLLLAAVDPDSAKVIGFTAASVAGNAALLTQPRLDEPTSNDAVAEMLDAVEGWASSLKLAKLTMIARRADPKWLKKHGFEVTRYIMEREIE